MDITHLLENCQVSTIIILGFIMFILDRRSEKRNEKLEHKIDHRFEKVEEQLRDVDRRLCRVEGSLSSKDCCMLKDDRQMRKAE